MSTSVPSAGSKILVTGASGFIGIHVVDSFLKAGHKVVGTVRSTSKGDYIKKQFEGKPFEYVIVEDIGKKGAFDEAVKGVEGVAHTASPFHFNVTSPEELIRPAVDGTVGVLESITKHNPSVKRVVITSSVAALLNGREPPYHYTEADWNELSPCEVKEKGDDAAGSHKYLASKTLAEQAAWKYSKEHNMSLVTINPPIVFGPILHQVDKPENLNTSVAIFWRAMSGQVKKSDLPGGGGGDFIDVRNVADAHVLALTKPEAEGRFVVSAGPWCTQQLTDAVLAIAPDTPNVPRGEEGAIEKANAKENITTSYGEKAEKVLGIKYISIDQSARDMYESLKARGW